VGGVAEDEGAGDVRLVAFDGAAVVDEDDFAFADDLRVAGTVRDAEYSPTGPMASPVTPQRV